MSNVRLFDTEPQSCRGQAYIAEALFAVILVAGVMFVATTTLAVDNPALSVDDREIQTEIEADAQTVLEQSKQDGSLKAIILNWDTDGESYVDAGGDSGNYLVYPPGLFGDRLAALQYRYEDRQVTANVKIEPSQNGPESAGATFSHSRPESYPLVQVSDAPNTLVTVDTHVTLYGDDQFQLPRRAHRITPAQSTASNDETKLADLEDGDEFPIPPASSYDEVDENDVYNVVNVRVIVWET